MFLELSRLGTVSLARKNKHQFPTLKLSSLGHHPHDPGYGKCLHQPPKLWNQRCFFWIFWLALFCILSKKRPFDLQYLSIRTLWQCKVKRRFLSTALNEDAHERSGPCGNSTCDYWEPGRTLGRSCFSLFPCVHLWLPVPWTQTFSGCACPLSISSCYVYRIID